MNYSRGLLGLNSETNCRKNFNVFNCRNYDLTSTQTNINFPHGTGKDKLVRGKVEHFWRALVLFNLDQGLCRYTYMMRAYKLYREGNECSSFCFNIMFDGKHLEFEKLHYKITKSTLWNAFLF